MSHWKGLLYACLTTLVITLVISVLPQADSRTARNAGDVSVFRPVPVKRLSSNTVVDSMISLHLALKVKKVAWNGSVLTVDLSNEEYGNAVDRWMDDLQRLFELAFIRTDNVSRVLVRFVAPLQPESDDVRGDARLLAAVDVRRTDAWLSTELSNLSAAKPFQDEIWRRRLRLSASQL
ncbi:hypothetical protein GZH47_04590 [Paenibacillus rhizovicinus]|uniref:Uncharacterized protein n=1 Tax=Paenibacillus rhizovicinus TaxID=2704463 RepID=A0A6C0P0F8_9BACL|nr:hypothetical protein [Paenibacillus rhizovicinus]QHW30192.1 hypothetical protein GZH47_04590 [Paenibacillus rhizovicinus]